MHFSQREIFLFFIILSFLFPQNLSAQNVRGKVIDQSLNEPVFGASVVVKETTTGAQTDFDGNFNFDPGTAPPFTLVISYLGFENQEIEVTKENIKTKLKVKLSESSTVIQKVEVIESRITEKQKESALTVESMGLKAIKETPAASFYDGLGSLKGVDLTTASLGFVVVNTRGFNSTRPVRSLQLVDGADNQAPGLNFSLGNFVGSSELDIQKVDLIVGASSALFGPNAFNGVINMTTKSPFYHHGLSVLVKAGERNLLQTEVRLAQKFKNKKDRDIFAYKLNFAYTKARDWEATNYAPTEDSQVDETNPGGYDAVNIYGDENRTDGQNNFTDLYGARTFPGLGIYHRTGYEEKDLVDYDSKNLKAGASVHFKLNENIETLYGLFYGTGTTVYQGDNRYSLKGLRFLQHRFEIKEKDRFYLRAYRTKEDAGQSYDAVFTALLLQDGSKENLEWSNDYNGYYLREIEPKVRALLGLPSEAIFPYNYSAQDSVLALYYDFLVAWHEQARSFADDSSYVSGLIERYLPGTARFDSAFNAVISKKTFLEGGSGFYDKSSLTHIQGEYIFKPDWLRITTGGSFRLYTPDSRGTIFLDTPSVKLVHIDSLTGDKTYDTTYAKINNYEFGFYMGLEKRFIDKRLILTATARLDKNQNYDFLISPAASAVYKLNPNHTFRLSFSSAIRNPTLQDQYLYYNVGRALLIGNIEGVDSLVTIESLINYYTELNYDTLDYFNVDPVKPEKVKSLEVGYKGTLFKRLFIDASYYYSWYKDFLGYKIGSTTKFTQYFGQNLLSETQIYRVSARG